MRHLAICLNFRLMDELPRASIIDYMFREYSRNAKRRNMAWALSKLEFANLISGDCNYCGKEPDSRRFASWGSGGSKPKISIEKVNGIDRVDNSQGYHVLNCVPCCTTCNRMKLAMSAEDLLAHVRKIFGWMNR